MLKLQENKLILSPELVALLKATSGDKIEVGYTSIDGKLTPIILVSENGNLLTKSNTVAFKGKKFETLIQFGDEFSIIERDGVLELKGNKENIIYTSVEDAIKEYTVDKSVVRDTNYIIQKFEIYEL